MLIAALVAGATVLGGSAGVLLGVCGPFTDVTDAAFCPFVLEIFTLGITTGTTPTTYDPASTVSLLQMAAFLSRTVDGVLNRGGRRAALDQFWTTQNAAVLGLTTVGSQPYNVKSDGADLWVSNAASASVSRVRGSDGKLLETWTGAAEAFGVLSAMGRIFVTGSTNPGRLYRIDPSQPAGAVTTVATDVGIVPDDIAFDGARIWTGGGGSVSIVTPGATIPWTVTTVTAGFIDPKAPIYDGANIWMVDRTASTILKLDAAGAILQTVTVGIIQAATPGYPAFDGANIWVPNNTDSSISVVRASTDAVLATLTGNGLFSPLSAAFDGRRVLVTDALDKVSLWKAADLTGLGSFPTGGSTFPYGVCSDGVNFWIVLHNGNLLVRF